MPAILGQQLRKLESIARGSRAWPAPAKFPFQIIAMRSACRLLKDIFR